MVNMINHIEKTFNNILNTTIQYSRFFLTRVLLHTIFNTWLAHATTCESQATACGDIEISPEMTWIGINGIFKKIYIFEVLITIFLK